jgi:hypothetical protein
MNLVFPSVRPLFHFLSIPRNCPSPEILYSTEVWAADVCKSSEGPQPYMKRGAFLSADLGGRGGKMERDL